MSRNCLAGLAIVVIAIGAGSRGAVKSARAEPEKTIKVSADDLNSGKVAVVGDLGVPLMTMTTVRGIWSHPDQSNGPTKDYDLLLSVTHVDGQPLVRPVVFHRGVVHVTYPLPWPKVKTQGHEPTPSDGEMWEFRAYETGRFQRQPNGYQKELGERSRIVQQSAISVRTFLVELHGIMQWPTVPKAASQHKEPTATTNKP